ncbi:hypothetical protein NMY22_g7431 [Coprinellus aureogranulatus]|nr:hypothetical protein NMY22_g7431 [Coprinellus aureogranulatus]
MSDSRYPYGLQLCRKYADYARHILQERNGQRIPVAAPCDISFGSMAEVEKMIATVCEAWNSPVRLPYSVREVAEIASGNGSNKDERLRKAIQGPFSRSIENDFPLFDRPMVFIDQEGVVVAWYLPGLYTTKRCEHVIRSVLSLSSRPKSILRSSSARQTWRNDDSMFASPDKCDMIPSHINVSICWYNLGYDSRNSVPGPSANLEDREGGAMEFLEDEAELHALVGALLSITNPVLFETQFSVLAELARSTSKVINRSTMNEAFHYWTSPFTGFALIVNRETPFHRDMKGGKMLIDILSVFGRYSQGRFEVPLLSARFAYNPATAIILPGFLYEHGASRTDGERICVASYFKPNVGVGALGGTYQEVPPPNAEYLAKAFGFRLRDGHRASALL